MIFGAEHLEWLGQVARALAARALKESIELTDSIEPNQKLPKIEIWKKHRGRGLKARKIGNLKTAEISLTKALVYCRARGLDGLPLAKTLNDLAEILRLQKRENEAEVLIRECLDVVNSCADIDGRATIPFYNNLAGLLYAKGQIAEAEQTYCQILEGLDQLGEGRWAHAIPVLCNLGTLCFGCGEITRAIQYHDKAVQLAIELWGELDPITLQCARKLEECRRLTA